MPRDGQDAADLFPAAYDEVVTVSALADYNGKPNGGASPNCSETETDDTFATFSNYGEDVDLGAPGVCIHTTTKGGGYATSTGTSPASPHVAGAAALYKKNPSATPSEVRAALILAAEPLGSGHTDQSGRHPKPVLLTKNF